MSPEFWAIIGVGVVLFLAILKVVEKLSEAIYLLRRVADETTYTNEDRRKLEDAQRY